MKKFEKIVPVLASGLVVAGLGTVDAFAVDEPDTPAQADTPPAETQQSETSNSSTEIKNVTTTTPPEQTETGGTATEGVVNLDVDSNGDTTVDGNITVTEKPDEPKIEESDPKPSGNPVVTPNPDGGSTSTTPTEVDVTETEKSEIDIEGEIKPQNPVVTQPSETEKSEIDGSFDALKNLDDVTLADEETGTSATEVNGFKAVDKSVENNDHYTEGDRTGSQTTTTVTFEKVVTGEPTDKPLTPSELGLILNVTLTEVEGQDKPTYTYTKADGTKVTVVVDSDTSMETLTTTYRVTVSQTTTTLNEKSETGSKDNLNDTIYGDGETDNSAKVDAFITDLLEAAEQNKGGYTKVSENKSDDGKTTTTIRLDDGMNLKEYIIEEIETPLAGAPANDVLLSWLGDDFVLSDGKIVTKEGGYEVSVTTDKLTGKTIVRTIQVYDVAEADKVVDENGNDIDGDKAASEAVQKAVVEAVEKALAEDGVNVATFDAVYNKNDDIWTVMATVTVDGVEKVYTYTVTSSSNKDNPNIVIWDAEKLAEEDVASGSTTTVTGNAYVSGETVVWTESKDSTVSFIGADGKVNVTVGNKIDDKEEVKTVTSTDDDAIVITVYTDKDGNKVTKTYTFKYNQELEEKDKKALLSAGQTADFNDLTKTTWTVEVKTESTNTEEKNETIITGTGLSKDKDGNYTYEDNERTITFENGNKTYVDGNITYTIVEEDIPLADLPVADIAKLLGDDYTDVAVKDGVITATYGGKTVTVSIDGTYKKLTVEKVFGESSTQASKDYTTLIENITKVVEALEPGEKIYANGHELFLKDGKLSIQDGSVTVEITKENIEEWIKPGTAVNFEAMDKEALAKYLDTLKTNSNGQSTSNHVDLAVEGTLHVEETGRTEQCVVIRDGLTFIWNSSADQIANDKGTEIDKLGDSISWDSAGHYEYQHSNTQQYKPTYSQFYKVSGTVAYGLYTKEGNETGKYTSRDAAQKDLAALKETYKDAIIVEFKGSQNKGRPGSSSSVTYQIYLYQADLAAYGYMDKDSNCCSMKNQGGYDLKLSNLTLLKDGKVTASGDNVTTYSVNLYKETTTTSSGTSLTVNSLTTSSSDTKAGTPGSEITGNYKITQTKVETDLKDRDGKWKHTGTGNFSYDTYKNWVEVENGNSNSSQYSGSLEYEYTIPEDVHVGDIDIDMDNASKKVEATRNVAAKLSSTSVSTSTKPGDPIVVVTPPTTTPGDNGGGGGGDRTPTPPTPPVVDIPEEDPPLVDVPEEEPPLVDIPEEEPPLVDIPEEEPPLVDVPEEEPPLVDVPDAQPPKVTIPAQKVPLAKAPAPSTVDILEEEVPLADVPKTGESPASLLAAAAASLSVLGLGILKKREED